MSIDVVRIILLNIHHIARQPTTGGLAHPYVIIELCRCAGVNIDPLEPYILAQPSIKGPTIQNYRAASIPNPPVEEPAEEPMPDHMHNYPALIPTPSLPTMCCATLPMPSISL